VRALEKSERKKGHKCGAENVEREEGRRGINFPEIIQKGNKTKGDKGRNERKRKGWTKCIDVNKSKEQEKEKGLRRKSTKENLQLYPSSTEGAASRYDKFQTRVTKEKNQPFLYHSSFTPS